MPSPFYALGKACVGSGELEKAIECYRRGLEINPQRHQNPVCSLGQAFFQKNELTLAKRQFEKALEENPREREARYFLGNVPVPSCTKVTTQLSESFERCRR